MMKKMAEIFSAEEHRVDISKIKSMLMNESDDGYTECSSSLLVQFLDNLIIMKRGPRGSFKTGTEKRSPDK